MSGIDGSQHIDALQTIDGAEKAGRPQPWERWPNESAKAYAAFAKYRDLAEARTFVKVAAMSNCSAPNIERWAKRWSWTHRAYAWDAMQEEAFRTQSARDRVAHRKRQVSLGRALQSIAAHGVAEWQRKMEAGAALDLRPDELVSLLRAGDELEAKGLGVD